MFNTTSYFKQSKGLPTGTEFEYMILYSADTATLFRAIGKTGSIIGVVSSVASAIFNCDCKLSAAVTIVGGLMWFCNHKLAQHLEPQAQSILEHLQKQRNEGTTRIAKRVKVAS